MELMKKDGAVLKKLNRYKLPLIALAVGLFLLLVPVGKTNTAPQNTTNELAAILEQMSGVGYADALISENGAVIVCDGASDPTVRLKVFKAVEAYTGLSCDKIQVFVTEQNQGRAK